MQAPFTPQNVVKFERERQKRIQQQTEFNLKITILNADKINELLIQEYINFADNKIISLYYQDILQKLSNFYYDSLQRVQITPQDLLQGDIEEVFYKKIHNHQEDIRRVSQPVSLLNITMKPYQIDGLRFLLSMFLSQLTPQQPITGKYASGLVLADDQGLGKTITSIAFLSYLKEKGLCRNAIHLIICPLSVSNNWVNEFKNHCRNLNVICYKGAERAQLRKQILKQTNQIDVIITTYDYILQDLKLFRKIDFTTVIVDEATRIKNQKSKLISILRYDIKCRNRILLSGTPLQNNIREFFTLLQFIHGTIFNDFKQFDQIFKHVLDKIDEQQDNEGSELTEEVYEQDTMTNQSDISTMTESTTLSSFKQKYTKEQMVLSGQQKQFIIDRLHGIIKPFLIRRLKKDVLDFLPPKYEHVIRCGLTQFQNYLYNLSINSGINNQEYQINNTSILPQNYYNNVQMYLRKICNHPFIALDKNQQQRLKQDWIQTINQIEVQLNDQQNIDKNKLQDTIKADLLSQMSSKLNLLSNMLIKLKQTGHRVLIFSQFRQVLDILEQFVQYKHYHYFRFDGEVKDIDRNKMVNEFNKQNSKYFCFLLSTRAASHGLNLQTADTVIIYDCDFNAFNDLQASDRVYRIGQTKTVKILKLYTNSYLEEKMYQIALDKMQLAETVINNDKFNQTNTYQIQEDKKSDLAKEATKVIKNILTNKQVIDQSVQLTSMNELNTLLSRNAREIEIFEQIDEQLTKQHQLIYQNNILEQFSQTPQFIIQQQKDLEKQIQEEYQLELQKKQNKIVQEINTQKEEYFEIKPSNIQQNNLIEISNLVTKNQIINDTTIESVKEFFIQNTNNENIQLANSLLECRNIDYVKQYSEQKIDKIDLLKICSSEYQNNQINQEKTSIYYLQTEFDYVLKVILSKSSISKLYIKYKQPPEMIITNLVNFNIRLIMTLHLSLIYSTNDFNYDDQYNYIPYYYSYLFYDFQSENVHNLKQILHKCLICQYYKIDDFINDIKNIQKYCKSKYGNQDLIYKLSEDLFNIIMNNLVLFFDQSDIEDKNDIITDIQNTNDCICHILENCTIIQQKDIQENQKIRIFGQGYYSSGLSTKMLIEKYVKDY